MLGMAACGDKTAVGESSDGTENVSDEVLTLISGGASQYKLVYADKASDVENNALMMIYEHFNSKFGIKLPITDDYLPEGKTHDGETCNIIVGQTNYAISSEAYEGLKYQDYRIIAKDTNIAIAAYSATGYDAAIKWLKNNVFNTYADGNLTMNATDVSEELVSGYPISKWTISDNELGKYQIVYADASIAEEVSDIRNNIAKKTGWYMKAGLDTELAETDYEILIGDTSREASMSVNNPSALNYVLEVVEEKLVIKLGGLQSSKLFWKDFFDIVVQDSKEVIMDDMYLLNGNFFDDDLDSSLATGTDVRVMSANVMADLSDYDSGAAEGGFDFLRRAEIFFAAVDFYEPTVVGVQEFCASWYEAYENYQFIEEWEILKFKNPNQNLQKENVFSTVMYRSDLYTLLDSGMRYYSEYNNGRCRCYTWAKLQDKKTGEQFYIISTHWDGGDTAETMKQVEELSEFVKNKNIPVFTTGDFNSNEWTQAWKKYIADTNSYDCRVDAGEKKRVNNVDSWHGWGVADTEVGGSADHITGTKSNTEILKFQTIEKNYQIWASDHAWLYCDFKLK